MPSTRLLTCALALAAALAMLGSSCAFSVTPADPEDSELTLELAAYPNKVSIEDSTATAEVWATVRVGKTPVKDNTVVKFATTVGTITSQSQTRDGLAVAILHSPGDNRPRRASVVAQAITVRDTLDLDFVLLEEETF